MVNGVVDDFSELTLILSKVVLSDMLDSQNNPTQTIGELLVHL